MQHHTLMKINHTFKVTYVAPLGLDITSIG